MLILRQKLIVLCQIQSINSRYLININTLKITFSKDANFMELPVSLVKNWLVLSRDNNSESQKAHDYAIKKLLHHFGNIDLAEDYVKRYGQHNFERS